METKISECFCSGKEKDEQKRLKCILTKTKSKIPTYYSRMDFICLSDLNLK